MKLNKQIMKSKNKGLIYSILEEISKYNFRILVRTTYKEGFVFDTIIKEKNWKEVFNLE